MVIDTMIIATSIKMMKFNYILFQSLKEQGCRKEMKQVIHIHIYHENRGKLPNKKILLFSLFSYTKIFLEITLFCVKHLKWI